MGGHKRTRPVTAWWCHSHSCGLAFSPNRHSRAFLSCGPTGSKGRVQLSRHVALSMSSTGWHVRAGCASPGRCPHATCSSPWEKWGPLCLAWDPALGSFFSPVFPSACPACASGGRRWGAGGLGPQGGRQSRGLSLASKPAAWGLPASVLPALLRLWVLLAEAPLPS